MSSFIAYDTETHLIQPGLLAPPIVCAQLQLDRNEPRIFVGADAEQATMEALSAITLEESTFLLLQNACFDMACVCATWPHLTELVFRAYETGRIIDVLIREKLLVLATTGNITAERYALDDIALRRLGIELDKENPWRLKFASLQNTPVAIWPKEAVEYALDDVRVLLPIYEEQEKLAATTPLDPPSALWTSYPLQARASFALYLMSCTGIAIDPEERARVEAMLAQELSEEKLEPLYASGILRRPEPARPHRNNPAKMTQPKPATRDMKLLQQIVVDVCTAHGLPIAMTDGGKKKIKQVSTASEVLAEIAGLDPRLEEYERFMSLQKLVTTEMPRIRAPRVHPRFNELVNTGRTSSYATDLYPSCNIQNVDPRARGCYVPNPGWVICSVDYSSLELVTLAQKLLDLFGPNKLADLILNGVDPHGYLGAQMAHSFAPGDFQKHTGMSAGGDDAAYQAFVRLKKLEQGTPPRDFYDHWRKFAKPVGLGYPGGLGPRTLLVLARGTYDIHMTIEEATVAREIWFETFPAMRDYFDWITRECSFMDEVTILDEETGEPKVVLDEFYRYASPMGMFRNRASYCAAANGAALQTPAAEGAKIAAWELARACFDPSRESILYGCRPWAFIHDEFLVNLPEDFWMHERAQEIARIMVAGMRQVIRDLPVRAEPALMRRWNKRAEHVLGEDGRIRVWEPSSITRT